MNRDLPAGSLIVASLLLGLSILGGAWSLSRSIERGGQQFGELASALAKAPGLAAAKRPAAQPRRPDPEQRYEIAVAGAPTRGPASAPVQIVEWSDFQ